MWRKRFLILAWAILFVSICAFAARADQVTAMWTANPPSEQVQGYTVYWGAASRTYTSAQDVPASITQLELSLPSTSKTFAAVKAWKVVNGARLESVASNEDIYDPAFYALPSAPTVFRMVRSQGGNMQ